VFVRISFVGSIVVIRRYRRLKVYFRRERQAEERGKAALLPAEPVANRAPVEG
jgi:hypothetical protein